MHGIDGPTAASGSGVGVETGRGVSRRSVLRTGALATAWSVPLVQVVAAAPAVAVSGATGAPPASLAVTGASGSWQGMSGQLATSVTLRNSGAGPTAGLQVTFTFPAGLTVTVNPRGGWTATTAGNVVTLTASQQIAAGDSVTLTPSFTPGPKSGALAITVSATATGTSAGTQINVA